MSDDWDVDSYKTEYENEEHWELRRNFMLAHKDKFPEDELVCLAQVFTNIEFLGCRYPEKTMIRVAELAKGVVESFREKRKDALKRTFVAASDAASLKVKGQLTKGEGPNENETKREQIQCKKDTSTNDKSENKCSLENDEFKRCKYEVGVKVNKQDKQVNEQAVVESELKKTGVEKVMENGNPQIDEVELGDFVLVLPEESEEQPIDLIQMNASLNNCGLKWKIEDGVKTCKLFLNGKLVGIGTGKTKKISKEEAAKVALTKLRESYYGIKMKSHPADTVNVGPAELGLSSDTSWTTLGEDNVGLKLMKLMGWKGGGLGSKEQGIKQPISAAVHVHKDGLGLKKSTFNMKELRKHAREFIQSWAKEDNEESLVFSKDFSNEERKVLHKIARDFSLKSKSYGNNEDRYLIISRKPNPQRILQQLLQVGGNSDRYELLLPAKN